MHTFKHKIVQYYKQQIQDKADAFRDMIEALTEDASNDAKGSAGDKHETALSMMHLEQEKLNHKLKEIMAQQAVIDKIDADATTDRIVSGSVIRANDICLFMSTALPKITIDGTSVIALSPQSPLGAKLMGMTVGDTFEIGNSKYVIDTIL